MARATQTEREQASRTTEAPATAEAAPAVETRMCPTRAQGPAPLFQHTLTVAQCQSKQRGLYHKCFTCVHGNGRR